MKIALSAERSLWLELPKSFPTASGELAREWEDGIVEQMREAWRGSLSARVEPSVRDALQHGLSRVQADDSVTLQFWPAASVANVVVHISAAELEPGEQRAQVPIGTGDVVMAPIVEVFPSTNLGVGLEARYLTGVAGAEDIHLGGVNYLFQNPTGFVAVASEPTVPELVGVMLEPLRELVRSIRVLGDDREWEPCSVDAQSLPARGETWVGPERSRVEQNASDDR